MKKQKSKDSKFVKNLNLMIDVLFILGKIFSVAAKVIVRTLSGFCYMQLAIFLLCNIIEIDYFLNIYSNTFLFAGLLFYHYLVHRWVLKEKW